MDRLIQNVRFANISVIQFLLHVGFMLYGSLFSVLIVFYNKLFTVIFTFMLQIHK